MKKGVVAVMKALFFDLDGTLIEINRREVEVIHETLNHFGLKVSKTRVKRLCSQESSYMDVYRKLELELNDDALQYWTSVFVKNYRLSMVRKGVKSTLKALAERHAILCVTSRETAEEVLRELKFQGIDSLFDHIVTRDTAARHLKQASIPFFPFHEQRRKLYECALALVGCSSNDAVAIGDMGRELRPAKDLGIITVGLITYKGRKKELEEASDFLISRMTRLRSVLSQLCDI